MTWERAGRGTARQHHAHVARPLLQRLEKPLYFFSRVQLDLREFREAEAAISSIFLYYGVFQKRPKVPCLLLLFSGFFYFRFPKFRDHDSNDTVGVVYYVQIT